MLVLTRIVGESIILENERDGSTVVVKVTKIRGKQVKLGIAAPQYISIHRKEKYDGSRPSSDYPI